MNTKKKTAKKDAKASAKKTTAKGKNMSKVVKEKLSEATETALAGVKGELDKLGLKAKCISFSQKDFKVIEHLANLGMKCLFQYLSDNKKFANTKEGKVVAAIIKAAKPVLGKLSFIVRDGGIAQEKLREHDALIGISNKKAGK